MASLRRLPVGIQAVETFSSRNCVYVDKTEHILRMTDEGMFYFLPGGSENPCWYQYSNACFRQKGICFADCRLLSRGGGNGTYTR